MRAARRNETPIIVAVVGTALLALGPGSVVSRAAPPEVQNLQVFQGTGLASVYWDPTPGASYYRAYIGRLSTLPNYCSEFVAPLVDSFFTDSAIPPSGDATVYLVSAMGGGGQGTLGQTSDGIQRVDLVDCDTDFDGVRDQNDNCPNDANFNQLDSDFNGTGDACQFEAAGVELLSRVPIDLFPADPGYPHQASDVWHYVSPGGEEYGILGLRNGTAFLRVTNPSSPVLVGYLDDGTVNETWRDMAVFGAHAYIVSDGSGNGLQIADLTNIDNDVVALATTTDLGIGFADAHNVFVNEDTGFLYLAIPNVNGGLGITALDLNGNPTAPTVAGSWTDTSSNVFCHDLQVVSFTAGPHAGKEIAFCFGSSHGLYIVDVTNKSNMFKLSDIQYPDTTYCHQGWITEDGRHVLIGDELDESNDPDVTTTTTYIVNIDDLSNPQFVTSFTNGLASIDHNLMIEGDFAFEANYSSGLRVFGICDVDHAWESGYFDTRPEDDAQSFAGAWGVDSQLPSGVVLISDRQRGLFVLDPSGAVARKVDKCVNGDPLLAACDACVAQVCAQKPSCCNSTWNQQCITRVRTICDSLVCPESAGNCSHTLCSEGAPLTAGCDKPPLQPSCVDAICAVNPDCCVTGWDADCIADVSSVCGMNCN